MSRVFSPYDLNPLGFNPLRQVLADSIDFDRLARSPIKLFITATNVRTGRGRMFRNGEITPDVLLASACLPTMFHAVEIDGEPYWDGGYAGNPTITPLVRESDAHDTILVQINPRERAEDAAHRQRDPRPAQRDLLQLAADEGAAHDRAAAARPSTPARARVRAWASMRTHRIMTDKLADFGASSKLNAEWEFLAMLKQEGRNSADAFLKEHGADIGHRSSADLDVLLAEC